MLPYGYKRKHGWIIEPYENEKKEIQHLKNTERTIVRKEMRNVCKYLTESEGITSED